MSSEGPNSGVTFSQDTSWGNLSWSNTSNLGSSDNSYATVSTIAGYKTYYLTATNFGFSIPSGATIDGIIVEWEGHFQYSSGSDSRVRIIKGGTIGATDKASGTNWPTSDAYRSYGGISDLWGESWTYSDINASTFGATISVIAGSGGTFSMDHVRITVYYTEAGGGTSIPVSAFINANSLIGAGRVS